MKPWIKGLALAAAVGLAGSWGSPNAEAGRAYSFSFGYSHGPGYHRGHHGCGHARRAFDHERQRGPRGRVFYYGPRDCAPPRVYFAPPPRVYHHGHRDRSCP